MATTKKMASEMVAGDVVRISRQIIRKGRFASRSEWLTVVEVTTEETSVGKYTHLHFGSSVDLSGLDAVSRPWKKYKVR